jgi:transposase
MPAIPPYIREPLWEQFAALLPQPQATHPLGCHRPRIPDQAVVDKLLQVLVFGCGYRRIADATCSATTIRRCRDEWAAARLMQHLERIALDAYDRMIGLDLGNLAVDGCTTKAPCGGQTAGPSPVDRGKQGLKRSMVTDARGIPLGAVPAPANRNDHTLLGATLDTLPPLGPLPAGGTVHLDRGYDYQAVRDDLAARGLHARIAERGKPAPIQAGHRWVVERTHAWMNNYGKLIRCTERTSPWSSSTSLSPAPSSRSVVSSLRPGPATGGRHDLGAAPEPAYWRTFLGIWPGWPSNTTAAPCP